MRVINCDVVVDRFLDMNYCVKKYVKLSHSCVQYSLLMNFSKHELCKKKNPDLQYSWHVQGMCSKWALSDNFLGQFVGEL